MNRKTLLIVASAFAMTVSACNRADNAAEQSSKTPGTAVGVDLGWMDKSEAPGDDFFAFANGNWVKSTEIPADRSSVGAFFVARQEVEKQNLDLINELSKANPDAGTNEGRIVSYYKAYTDQAAIDRAGMAPVKADLDRFAAIQDKQQLAEVLGSQIRADVDPFNATDFNTDPFGTRSGVANTYSVCQPKSYFGTARIISVLPSGQVIVCCQLLPRRCV